jgi:hypothetical protein
MFMAIRDTAFDFLLLRMCSSSQCLRHYFICGLFNDAVSSSDYVAPNDVMISE